MRMRSTSIPVTPGALLPVREMLADLLLENGAAADALKEYEAVLKTAPRRFNATAGAARAADKVVTNQSPRVRDAASRDCEKRRSFAAGTRLGEGLLAKTLIPSMAAGLCVHGYVVIPAHERTAVPPRFG